MMAAVRRFETAYLDRIRAGLVLALALFAVSMPLSVLADDRRPTTPEGRLARSAGAYLGALEYISVFRKSECAAWAPRNTPTFDDALKNDVLVAFSAIQREEVRLHMNGLKPVLAKQAPDQVGGIIATFKRQEHDPKIACSLAASTLAMSLGQAFENWRSTKQQWGYKRN